MSKEITSKGPLWEWSNSLWIGWTFTMGIFNWISFFYIGARARCSKWYAWGLFYFVPFMLIMSSGKLDMAFSLGMMLMIPMGVMSVIHACMARREYLIRLEAIEKMQTHEEAKLLEEVEEELSGRRGNRKRNKITPPPPLPQSQSDPFADEMISFQSSNSSYCIDINNDSEEKIAQLPGFNQVLARKAVLIRNMSGAFNSIDDFGSALELTPEELERIRPIVNANPMKNPPTPPQKGTLSDF